ncbi:MAG: phospholipase [Acidobacteria bacterium]|nr:phospholipase [Acidobacteriota bacterium]
MSRKTIVKPIPATTHGRYLLEIPERPGPHPLLIGFHGYGENAEVHAGHLRKIPGSSEWLVAAVQALHPFYDRKSGGVVASWMTRVDREFAIRDNVDYVARVVSQIGRDQELCGRLVYAGFSQGVAMAYRAAAYAGHPCHGLVILCGDIPPDLRADPSLRLPPVLVARGRNDDWYTQQKMDSDIEFLASRKVPVETLVFEGGHEWTAEFVQAADSFLHSVASR